MQPDFISENVCQLRRHFAAVGSAASATLIAVAKTFPAVAVRAAAAAGVTDIGENYLQEAEEKISICADLPLTWHFIGKLQKNKAKRVAALFDWVHSVDDVALARRLSEARAGGKPLNIFMQVNLSAEESKNGVPVEQAQALAEQLAALPNLALRGLMIMPAVEHDSERQYAVFCRAINLQKKIAADTGIAFNCISMGMSGDYLQALRAGATHLRLGSVVFGARRQKEKIS